MRGHTLSTACNLLSLVVVSDGGRWFVSVDDVKMRDDAHSNAPTFPSPRNGVEVLSCPQNLVIF